MFLIEPEQCPGHTVTPLTPHNVRHEEPKPFLNMSKTYMV